MKIHTAAGAPLPVNEAARLEALGRYRILDSTPEEAFDDLVHAAALICRCPIALLSLVDASRQWFKAKMGLADPQTARKDAFCAHAILGTNLMVVPDTHADSRFEENALVTGDPFIRFYAGAPVITPDGLGLGTLCVIDKVPRSIGEAEMRALRGLARQAMIQLELRRTILEVDSVSDHAAIDRARREGEQRLRQLLGYPKKSAP